MATALGAIRGEFAGKHLNASAHVAKNFDGGAKSQTFLPVKLCDTNRRRMCRAIHRAMRASYVFLKAAFLPHILLSCFGYPVLHVSIK